MGKIAQILLVGTALLLAGCERQAEAPARVEAAGHEAFFLWAGVKPPPELESATTVYALAGEVRARDPDSFVSLRPPPRVEDAEIWLVVRVETLAWGPGVQAQIDRELARWDRSSNLVGLQIDFDSATQGLEDYAAFLSQLRRHMPSRYRLSITGLMDWSANGDPAALVALAGTVDEVVIQTYQGRHTIPGYEAYLASLRDLPMPYRIAVVEGGEWQAPPGLAEDPDYRGTVVFLLAGAE
ncbi:MAG: DUF3142 domain-containing protein [Sphingomonadaceae bacterium]|nr:DUF3142 domain-containing protein [Sphingomonadaceae bacterium]